jgi:phage tail sheath protein FI
MRKLPLVVLMGLTAPAFAAATGQVVAPDGAPVAGAQVCEFVEGTPERCVTADAHGVYRMEDPQRRTLLVRTSGFVPKTIDATPLNTPVVLQRAASLMVTVVDAATGAPLASGRVMINTPAGQRLGDFVPFNKAGVRISTLSPGTVFVRAEAQGYDPGGPLVVDLVGGAERSLKVSMTKSRGSAH